MDLIRLILMEVETGEQLAAVAAYGDAAVLYHYDIAIERGLIAGNVIRGMGSQAGTVVANRLTWEGHDFLDAARDEAIWRKATGQIAEKGGAWTFDILKSLLTKLLSDVLLGG